MPEWNLGQILSNSTARIGRRADVPASTASLFANQAYLDVSQRANHALFESKAVMSTSSGSDIVGLPDDFDEPIVISLATDVSSAKTLERIDVYEYDAIHQEDGSLGIPDRYAIYRDCLELHPSPDSAYSIEMRYKSFVSELVNTSDVPSINTGWRFAIVLKTEQYLMEYVNDFAGAASKRNEYLDFVRSLDDDYAKRQKDRSGVGVWQAAY